MAETLETEQLAFPLAGWWRRMGALSYELLIVAALWVTTGFLILPLVSARHSAAPVTAYVMDWVERGFSFIYLFSVTGFYFCWFWSRGRSTLPMKTWHLKLLERTGAKLAVRTAIKRYLAACFGPALAIVVYVFVRGHSGWIAVLVIALANYGWAWFDRDRQFLHDRIAGTMLVIAR